MSFFCIHRDFQSVFITVITKTELPKTLRSVQCHRKIILSANCEALCHLDKLRITAMCNFIAFFADVSMSSHFIGDFVFGLSRDRIMIRCQLHLSYCLQWTTDFTSRLFGSFLKFQEIYVFVCYGHLHPSMVK